jgi:5-formyltetrahydrofolate cyclo-ligase
MADDTAAIAARKAGLRAKLRFRRDHHVGSVSDLVRAIAFRAPPGPLRDLLTGSASVGGYIARRGEAPVDALLQIASDASAETALPCFAQRDDRMVFARWTAGDAMIPGPWRVDQPVDCTTIIMPDLLLCPLLGFDRNGSRIGQGGGHYDRYFAAHPATLRIGIAWSVQEVDAIPLEAHDLPLDAVLTEQEWIVTGDRL